MKRIAIIQGHPDAAGHHLLNAMADAYADAASLAGHQVRRIEVAQKNPKTIHYRGYGTFVVDGQTIKLKSRMR